MQIIDIIFVPPLLSLLLKDSYHCITKVSWDWKLLTKSLWHKTLLHEKNDQNFSLKSKSYFSSFTNNHVCFCCLALWQQQQKLGQCGPIKSISGIQSGRLGQQQNPIDFTCVGQQQILCKVFDIVMPNVLDRPKHWGYKNKITW